MDGKEKRIEIAGKIGPPKLKQYKIRLAQNLTRKLKFV